MTPDGISDDDWNPVRALAEKIAAISECNDDLRDQNSAELLDYLNSLESKYGKMPSILATKADYVTSPVLRLCLLKTAFERAMEIGDTANKTYISSSLAEMYIEELNDERAGVEWLKKLEAALADYWDDGEYRVFCELSNRLSRE